jgi:hypothetical protein
MIAWTRFVVRHRGAILGAWLVVFVLGAAGAANLGGLLSNRFSVPGSDSDRGLNILKDRMGDRSDGAFTLVVVGNAAQATAAAQRAAKVVPGAKAGPPLDAGKGVTYVQISTPLENQDASRSARCPARARTSPAIRRSTTTRSRSSART